LSLEVEIVDNISFEAGRAFLEPVLGTPTAAQQFARLLTSPTPHGLLAVEDQLATLTVPTLVVWGIPTTRNAAQR
jgi:hypothetical protein